VTPYERTRLKTAKQTQNSLDLAIDNSMEHVCFALRDAGPSNHFKAFDFLGLWRATCVRSSVCNLILWRTLTLQTLTVEIGMNDMPLEKMESLFFLWILL